MSFRIVADSSCDRTSPMADWKNITFVPLTLELGDYSILDDENFDAEDFVKRTEEYGDIPKTACPSPAAWAEAFDCEEDEIYVITITSQLSGTYNSALQGVELYREENPNSNKNIYVFDSRATSGLMSLIAERIYNCKNQDKNFDETVEDVENYIKNGTKLYFVLETLDVLKKNGRMGYFAANLLKKLRVKMVLQRTNEGIISYITQDLSMNRAFIKMANIIAEDIGNCDMSDKKLVITHVCCKDRAEFVAEKIAEKVNFGKVEIVKCSGLNTVYASNGGVIVSYEK